MAKSRCLGKKIGSRGTYVMLPWSILSDSNSSLPSDFQSQSLHHQPLPEWSLQRALMLWNPQAVHQGQVPALLALLSVPACPVSSVSQHPNCPTDLSMYLCHIFNCILAFVLVMTVQVTTGHLFSKINNIYLDPKRKKKSQPHLQQSVTLFSPLSCKHCKVSIQ